MRAKSSFAVARLFFCALLLALFTLSTAQPTDITVWGLAVTADDKGADAIVRAFEAKHPEYHVHLLGMGAGGGNAQKLMTAIIGNAGPDVIKQDRFTVHDWASRGAFLSLNQLIARDKQDPYDPVQSDYFPGAWAEGVYQGSVYCIPVATDVRVFYWNKTVFREKAADLIKAGLDPTRPPRTWSELKAYNRALTVFNPDHTLKTVGFIPNHEAFRPYGFIIENDGSYLSEDGLTATFDNPANLEALKFMTDEYKFLGGYENTQAFTRSFGYDSNNPFMDGRVAMIITGEWELSAFDIINPHAEFGAAPIPVPDDRWNHVGRFAKDKNTFVTWIGGFGWAIPTGAKHVQAAWEFIKFAQSLESRKLEMASNADLARSKGRRFLPAIQGLRPATQYAVAHYASGDSSFEQAYRVHAEAMEYAVARRSTFAASVVFDASEAMFDQILSGREQPDQAAHEANVKTQNILNEFVNMKRMPVADLSPPFYIALGVFGTAALGFIWWVKSKVKTRLAMRETLAGYGFIAPWIFGFVVFTAGPMIASILFSFTVYNVLSPPHWVGMGNYSDIFLRDWPQMSKAFTNVIYMAGFSIPLGNAVGLCVALLLNTGVKGMKAYRSVFYLPAIVPGVAAAVIWMTLFRPDPGVGAITHIWEITAKPWFGVPTPTWFESAEWAKPALIFMGVWGAGSGFLLWLAGLKGIPTTLYEAAEIDGASPWVRFVRITIPQLSPLIFFNLVMSVIGAMQMFDTVYIVTNSSGGGGPGESMLMPVVLLFQHGFIYFRMGYASALAWVLFAIILGLTLINIYWGKLWVHTEA